MANFSQPTVCSFLLLSANLAPLNNADILKWMVPKSRIVFLHQFWLSKCAGSTMECSSFKTMEYGCMITFYINNVWLRENHRHTMKKCVQIVQLEISRIPQNLFGPSAHIILLFEIFMKKALITWPLFKQTSLFP